MQKRRADILEDLLSKLNPQFYMVSCRILMSECAEALTALRDLNEEKMKASIRQITNYDLPKRGKREGV